jgi:hypothetical protein
MRCRPKIVSVKALSTSRAALFWQPPVSDGGMEITSWHVQRACGSSSDLGWETIELRDVQSIRMDVDDLDAPTTSVLTEGRGNRASPPPARPLSRAPTLCGTVFALRPALPYIFRIAGVNAKGRGEYSAYSEALRIVGELASAPRKLELDVLSPSEVSVRWKCPEYDGGYPIVAYEVQMAPAETVAKARYGEYVAFETVAMVDGTHSSAPDETASELSTAIEIVKARLPYVFRVRAITGRGEGDFTSLSEPIMTQGTQPSMMRAPEVTMLTADSVQLLLCAPEDTGGMKLRYEVQQIVRGSDEWGPVQTASSDRDSRFDSSVTTVIVSKLRSYFAYRFRCRALNDAGTGAWSTMSNEYQSVGQPPSRILKASAKVLSDRRVHLTWDAPESDGGLELTEYEIQQSIGPGTFWSTIATLPCGEGPEEGWHQLIVTGLQPLKRYAFRIRASNDLGTAPFLQTDIVEPTVCVPWPPSALVSMSTSAPGCVLLRWNSPSEDGGKPVHTFRVEAAQVASTNLGESERLSSAGANLDWRTVEVVRLPPNEEMPLAIELTTAFLRAEHIYTFRVCALNAVGCSAFSECSLPGVRPGGEAPGLCIKPRAIITPDQKVMVKWQPPVSDGGWPVIRYEVREGEFDDGIIGVMAKEKSDETGSKQVRTWLVIEKVLPNEPMRFQIRAANSLGVGKWSDWTNKVATNPQPPAQVTSVIAEQQQHTSGALLRWDTPHLSGGAPVTSYLVEFARCDQTGRLKSEWTSAPEACTDATARASVDGLMANQYYTFRVRALNVAGAGLPSAPARPVLVEGSVPAPPERLELEEVDGMSVRLNWTTPANHGGLPITRYEVQRKTVDESEEQWKTLKSAKRNPKGDGTDMSRPTLVLSVACARIQYEFRVRIGNSMGFSRWALSNKFATVGSAPPAPLRLKPTLVSPSELLLEWEMPSGDLGGLQINSYTVQQSEQGGPWQTVSLILPTGKDKEARQACTLSALRALCAYTFRVRATNDAGEGAFSAPSKSVTLQGGTAGAPLNLCVKAINGSSIEVAFRAPVTDGGWPVTKYEVQASPPGLQAWVTVATQDAARSPDGQLAHAERFLVQGIRAGRPMAYRVRALNRMGAGVCSDASENVTTIGTAPSQCAKPTAVVKGSGMLEVSWARPSDGGSDITGYQCQMAEGMPQDWIVAANVVADKSTKLVPCSCLIEDLDSKSYHFFRVMARNAFGDGPISEGSNGFRPKSVPPGAPLAPEARAINSRKVVLRWKPARDDLPVEKYVIECAPAVQGVNGANVPPGDWRCVAQASSLDTMVIIEDEMLMPARQYFFRLCAEGEGGSGAYALVDEAVALMPEPPSEPLSPLLSAGVPGGLTFSWRPPASDGGLPLLGYDVQYMCQPVTSSAASWASQKWVEFGRIPPQVTVATATSMNANKKYIFRVQAISEFGDSEYSAQTEPVTPFPAPPCAPKITGVLIRADKLYWEMSWERPTYDSGIGVTSYEVQKATKRGDDVSPWLSIRFQRADELQTLIEIERQTEDSTILFRVRASNSAGEGEPSEPVEPPDPSTPAARRAGSRPTSHPGSRPGSNPASRPTSKGPTPRDADTKAYDLAEEGEVMRPIQTQMAESSTLSDPSLAGMYSARSAGSATSAKSPKSAQQAPKMAAERTAADGAGSAPRSARSARDLIAALASPPRPQELPRSVQILSPQTSAVHPPAASHEHELDIDGSVAAAPNGEDRPWWDSGGAVVSANAAHSSPKGVGASPRTSISRPASAGSHRSSSAKSRPTSAKSRPTSAKSFKSISSLSDDPFDDPGEFDAANVASASDSGSDLSPRASKGSAPWWVVLRSASLTLTDVLSSFTIASIRHLGATVPAAAQPRGAGSSNGGKAFELSSDDGVWPSSLLEL